MIIGLVLIFSLEEERFGFQKGGLVYLRERDGTEDFVPEEGEERVSYGFG